MQAAYCLWYRLPLESYLYDPDPEIREAALDGIQNHIIQIPYQMSKLDDIVIDSLYLV